MIWVGVKCSKPSERGLCPFFNYIRPVGIEQKVTIIKDHSRLQPDLTIYNLYFIVTNQSNRINIKYVTRRIAFKDHNSVAKI